MTGRNTLIASCYDADVPGASFLEWSLWLPLWTFVFFWGVGVMCTKISFFILNAVCYGLLYVALLVISVALDSQRIIIPGCLVPDNSWMLPSTVLPEYVYITTIVFLFTYIYCEGCNDRKRYSEIIFHFIIAFFVIYYMVGTLFLMKQTLYQFIWNTIIAFLFSWMLIIIQIKFVMPNAGSLCDHWAIRKCGFREKSYK